MHIGVDHTPIVDRITFAYCVDIPSLWTCVIPPGYTCLHCTYCADRAYYAVVSQGSFESLYMEPQPTSQSQQFSTIHSLVLEASPSHFANRQPTYHFSSASEQDPSLTPSPIRDSKGRRKLGQSRQSHRAILDFTSLEWQPDRPLSCSMLSSISRSLRRPRFGNRLNCYPASSKGSTARFSDMVTAAPGMSNGISYSTKCLLLLSRRYT